MNTLYRLRASATFARRSLRSTWLLSVGVALALATLIGVWVGLPLYAESASARLLASEVDASADDGVPFGYLFSYNRLSGGNKSWTQFNELNQLLDGPDALFGQSVRSQQRLVTTVPFDATRTTGGERVTLDTAAFASVDRFDDLATITAGRHARPTSDGPIEVVIDESFAEDLEVVPGERLEMLNRRVDLDDPRRTFEITVVGTWLPPERLPGEPISDPEQRFLVSGALTSRFVVPEATIAERLDAAAPEALSNAQWLVLLDSTTVTTDGVNDLLNRTSQVNRLVDDRLPGTRVVVSPETSLRTFRSDVARLERGLRLFSIPTLGLALAVVALIATMRTSRQQAETLLLRRRGLPMSQVLATRCVEALVLVVAGSAVGLLIARGIAWLMGRSTSFMQFGSEIELALTMNPRAWRSFAVAVVLALVLAIAPTIPSVRQDLATDRVHAARSRPWLQRTRLDLVVCAVVGFFAWFLLRRDRLQRDLLDDPVVILLPALTAVAVGLAALRFVPWAAGAVARLLEGSRSTAALLVLRRIARRPAALAAPLLLLVMTTALAVYTGSLARTLDLQLFDTAYHLTGAANRASSETDPQLGQQFEIVNDVPSAVTSTGPSVDQRAFSRIWGVKAASRFAQLPARVDPGGDAIAVTYTGIDPSTFGEIAFWRDDYADLSLPDLMQRLQRTPDAVLLPTNVARAASLRLGDVTTVAVRIDGRIVSTEMVLVGTFEQFPAWSPANDPPPAVASLASFEARSPATVARQLLFETDDRAPDLAQQRADLRRLGVSSTTPARALDLVERTQESPDRQGVFGLLTVGFVLSVVLTIAGFVFYAFVGFTRQVTELGILRAFGMPIARLRMVVVIDLLILGLAGVGLGALAGLAMGRWYLPRLVSNPLGPAPTLLAELDWLAAFGISAALLAALIVVAVGLLAVLRRLKLFEALKLDQTTAGAIS